MSITALKKLVESSKASVLVGVVAILAVLLYLAKIDADQFLSTIQIVVPGWMLAHAGETGAKALANGKVANKARPRSSSPSITFEVDVEDSSTDKLERIVAVAERAAAAIKVANK